MNKKTYPSLISIDWLQVYCHQLDPNWTSIVSRETIYDIRKLDYGSRQFKTICDVYSRDGRMFAQVQCDPCSSVLTRFAAIIKLDNRVLYCNDCVTQLLHFMAAYSFEYKNISRIDICHDSNYLAHGLRHSSLINGFLTNKYQKIGLANYTLQGADGANHTYSYIRFGSRANGACCYMYDKTKELREVKNKPYIVDAWIREGIDVELSVWRCEISIKADATRLVDINTGQLFRLSTDIILQQSRIEQLFHTYADKYFHFVRNKGQKHKKNMETIELFEPNAMPSIKVNRVSIAKNSGRMQKIMFNKMRDIADNGDNYSFEAREAALLLSKEYVTDYGMERIVYRMNERNTTKR